MHTVAYPIIKDFSKNHPDAETTLNAWYKTVKETNFENFSQLRKAFPTADKINSCIVFNIGGNKYRLIAAIHFNRKKIYIRHILTHVEYDQGKWKSGCKKQLE